MTEDNIEDLNSPMRSLHAEMTRYMKIANEQGRMLAQEFGVSNSAGLRYLCQFCWRSSDDSKKYAELISQAIPILKRLPREPVELLKAHWEALKQLYGDEDIYVEMYEAGATRKVMEVFFGVAPGYIADERRELDNYTMMQIVDDALKLFGLKATDVEQFCALMNIVRVWYT